MRMGRAMLGIAVTNGRCFVAEVAAGTLRGSMEMEIASGDGKVDWAALGRQLRHQLRRQRLWASRCVIGLDAAWVVAKPKCLGPTPPAALAGVLGLAIEREFSSGAEGFVFDYLAPPDTKSESTALLLAASRPIVDGVTAMAEAAGLTLVGITCSSLSLAAAAGAGAGEQAVLYVREGCAEIAVRGDDGWRALRRLAAPAAGSIAATLEDARRVLGLLAAKADAGERRVLLWDELGLDAGVRKQLADRLGLPVVLGRFPEDLGLATSEVTAATPVVQAAALALEGLSGRALVDFAHSRLAPAKPQGRRRQFTAAAVAAAVVLIAAGWFALDWWSCARQSNELQQQLDELAPSVAAAKTTVDDVTFARGWYDRRGSLLECLRQVTAAFPERGRAWATNLSVRDEKKVLLTGKCEGEALAMQIMDNLKACPRFVEVKSLYIRHATNSSEVTFAVSFDYKAER